MSRGLSVGSLRGIPQTAAVRPKAGGRPGAAAFAVAQSGTELPPSRRGQRCCRTGCAGCPVGEAIRRARAAAG